MNGISYLQLAALGWGFLAATFIGFVIHGNQKHRAARDFHTHTTTAMRVSNHPTGRTYLAELMKPQCPECLCVYEGPESDHLCHGGY